MAVPALAQIARLSSLEELAFNIDVDYDRRHQSGNLRIARADAHLEKLQVRFKNSNPSPSTRALGTAFAQIAGRLPSLRAFELNTMNPAIDRDGVEAIAASATLQDLTLNRIAIDDRGLEAIGRLTGLRRLVFGEGQFNGLPFVYAGGRDSRRRACPTPRRSPTPDWRTWPA